MADQFPGMKDQPGLSGDPKRSFVGDDPSAVRPRNGLQLLPGSIFGRNPT
jgi:hypothetical protein